MADGSGRARAASQALSAGLSASVGPVGEWLMGRALRLDFALRNTGATPATLPKAADLFGYLILVQGRTAHYTEKIFHARALDWPATLAPGQSLSLPAVDVGNLLAFSYKPGLKIVDGYPAEMVGGRPKEPAPVGAAGKLLLPGPVKLKYVAYLPRDAEGALLLVGNVLKLEIRISRFQRLPPEEKQRVLDDLSRRMSRDAWSAKVAHDDAVGIGRPAIPTLTRILNAKGGKYFARMWAVTALADIGGEGVVGTLIECLTDPAPGVRHAAAYHGLKARSGDFDKALAERACGGADPMLAAWAIMGHLKFRGRVPPELLAAGVESEQWQARAAVVETISRAAPDRTHAPILRRLALDENAQIRATAARTLGFVQDRSFETFEALVKALAMEGEAARHAAAGALCRLAGKQWTYTQSLSPEQRKAVVARWRQWWAENRSAYRGGGS